jgi:hypothetical protein
MYVCPWIYIFFFLFVGCGFYFIYSYDIACFISNGNKWTIENECILFLFVLSYFILSKYYLFTITHTFCLDIKKEKVNYNTEMRIVADCRCGQGRISFYVNNQLIPHMIINVPTDGVYLGVYIYVYLVIFCGFVCLFIYLFIYFLL